MRVNKVAVLAALYGWIYQFLGRELAHKIKVSNSLLSTRSRLA
jgi:hypothetical protein